MSRAIPKGVQIDYSETIPSIKDPIPAPVVVDKHGEPIKLTSWQKNRLYAQAKEARRRLEDKLCTRRETHRTDPQTVRKMRESEFACHGTMDKFSKMMQAIGADPKDISTDRLRRR